MFTDKIPKYSFCRKWTKADTIGSLISWDSRTQTGWIQIYSTRRNCFTRFSVELEYDEIDKSDRQFINYFINPNRTYYKGPTKMIAFNSPYITIHETDEDSVITFQIHSIFISHSNSITANSSNITFKYDVKKDTISTILKEFSTDFLEDTSENSCKFCKVLGKEMTKVFNKWILSKSDEEIETIVI